MADLDTKTVKSEMLKGIVALEHGLYDQAKFEFERINKIRPMLTEMEDEIVNTDLHLLTPEQKLKLYNMLNSNMGASLLYLLNVHKGTAASLEIMNNVEALRDQAHVPEEQPEDLVLDLLGDKIMEHL